MLWMLPFRDALFWDITVFFRIDVELVVEYRIVPDICSLFEKIENESLYKVFEIVIALAKF